MPVCLRATGIFAFRAERQRNCQEMRGAAGSEYRHLRTESKAWPTCLNDCASSLGRRSWGQFGANLDVEEPCTKEKEISRDESQSVSDSSVCPCCKPYLFYGAAGTQPRFGAILAGLRS